MADLKDDLTKAETAASTGIGWVKTHVMLTACLVCFLLGAVCGYLLHHH